MPATDRVSQRQQLRVSSGDQSVIARIGVERLLRGGWEWMCGCSSDDIFFSLSLSLGHLVVGGGRRLVQTTNEAGMRAHFFRDRACHERPGSGSETSDQRPLTRDDYNIYGNVDFDFDLDLDLDLDLENKVICKQNQDHDLPGAGQGQGCRVRSSMVCCPGFRVQCLCLRLTPNGRRLAVTFLVHGAKVPLDADHLTASRVSHIFPSVYLHLHLCLHVHWALIPIYICLEVAVTQEPYLFQAPPVRYPDSKALLVMCTQVARMRAQSERGEHRWV